MEGIRRLLACGVATLLVVPPLSAQIPRAGEVRQIVSLSFTPGGAAEGTAAFEELAVPLYRLDSDMLSFRGYREVESSIPLDLVVISAFRGMAGMDASNEFLGSQGIGRFYGRVGPLLARHTDQFVEMLPALGQGDPSTAARTVLIWYRTAPGSQVDFEEALAETVVPYELAAGIPAQTGRFLLGDGWHYLRFVGVQSLGGYQAYLAGLESAPGYAVLATVVVSTREVMLRSVSDLAVR